MTTIEENMDEFFNFEDAAQVDIDFSDLPSGPYDIDLAFNEPENDENSFTCLQHFSNQDALTDTTMMGPADFMDFPRWIDGMDVPTQPCSYCRRMRIHCKVIKEGIRKGSCTSCVALAKSCSLTDPPPQRPADHNMQHSQTFPLSGVAVDESTSPKDPEWMLFLADPCENCRRQDLTCRSTPGRACSNCIQFSCQCSFTADSNASGWAIRNDRDVNGNVEQPPLDRRNLFPHSHSTPDLIALKSSDENLMANEHSAKVGARFSRESIRILRAWLSTHQGHPYPTDDEKDALQRQTGLNKTQITNWLANARRRGKVRAPRSTSPSVHNLSDAMDIPRRATPALENMNPLERWKHSPPEHEPASITAISKAIYTSTY